MNIKTDKEKLNHTNNASLTVEAAFIIPISFYFMLAMLYFFLLLHTQFTVYQGMLAVSDKIYSFGSIAAYAENSVVLLEVFDFGLGDEEWSETIGTLIKKDAAAFLMGEISEEYISELLEDWFSDNDKELKFVAGGASGLDCSKSYAYVGNGSIVINVTYTFEFPDFLFFAPNKDIEQRLEITGFYGVAWDIVKEFETEKKSEDNGENEEDDEYVYVARTGQVYHIDQNCTYIAISISEVGREEIGSLRNSSGAKYYPCEYCGYNSGSEVYITVFGNRYHSRDDCSRINRDVKKITKTQAVEEGKRACSKCSG